MDYKIINNNNKNSNNHNLNKDKDTAQKSNDYNKIIKKKGHFKYGDKLAKIVYASPMITNIKDKFLLVVKWKARNDGSIPKKSILTNQELQEYDPVALSQFYEKILLGINSKKIAKKGKYLLMLNEKN